MSAFPVAIVASGLVTSVGLSAAQSCAAFRAKVTNPSETRFIDSDGEWIIAHQVPLDEPWRGLAKLVKMAAMAASEALEGVPREKRHQLPLILCVAEPERPGRIAGLDDQLFEQLQEELATRFDERSVVVAHGRVGVAVALAQARRLLNESRLAQVLVVATDTLVSWPTLRHYEHEDRLLTPRTSDGFAPGEAAGALLVGRPTGHPGELVCTGIGFGREPAHLTSGEPLRADGLVQAVKGALAEAGREMNDFDFRISDNSGEQYYFKEAALALSRTLRTRRPEFDIWHPAECTGEVGAAAGMTIVATARAACSKRYAIGPNILAQMANDNGQRAALSLQYRVAA